MFQDSVPAGSYNDPFLSSVCMCMCIYICIYIHIYVYIYIYMYVYVYVYVYVCMYIYVCVYVYIYVCACAYICIEMSVCVWVCIPIRASKQTNKQKLHNAQVCHLFDTAWDDEHLFIEHLSSDHLKFVIPIWNPHLETNRPTSRWPLEPRWKK